MHSVTVRVDDGEFYAIQSKPIRVRTNVAPLLQAIDDVRFTGGSDWNTKAIAVDDDKDPVEFSIALQSGQPLPAGLSIDALTGEIQWKSLPVLSTTSYPLACDRKRWTWRYRQQKRYSHTYS